MASKTVRSFVIAATGTLLLTSCAGPSTQAELCASYREVVNEWFTFDPNAGTFDNAAFDALEDLADVAERLPNSPAINQEGERLADLAEGDGGFIVSVSAFEVERNTANISVTCR